MKIHFVLRNTYENKDGVRQIQLVYCANNKQVKLDTGVRIRVKDWIESKQQVLSSVSEIGKTGKELNDKLNEKKNKVLTIVGDFKKEHETITANSFGSSCKEGIEHRIHSLSSQYRLLAKSINSFLFFVIFRCVWPFVFPFFPSHHFSFIFSVFCLGLVLIEFGK